MFPPIGIRKKITFFLLNVKILLFYRIINVYPMVGVTGNWVYIGGELVSYDAEPVKKTDEGYVYNGRVKAKLTGEDIILYIEWNPVQNEGDLPTEGTIRVFKII